MKSIVRGGVSGGLLAGAMLTLSACGSVDGKRDSGPAVGPSPVAADDAASDRPVKLGAPFTIGGTTYTPADIPDYDDVGYASWYGDELAGRPTANGEDFDPAGISAAHKTLPLPSYVEVTALDTGRTILVRVNDRGPMVNDRLIDLSRGAAEQLGITGGVAAVRVRRTNPPQAERAQLRAGKAIPERIATPDSLLAILRRKMKDVPVPANAPAAAATAAPAAKPAASAPQPAAPVASAGQKPGDDRFIVEGPGTKPAARPVTTPAPPAQAAPSAGGGYTVQVAAFSSKARADTTARLVGGTVSKAGNVWRVRIGPLASDAEAQAALAKAKSKGFLDAVVVSDR